MKKFLKKHLKITEYDLIHPIDFILIDPPPQNEYVDMGRATLLTKQLEEPYKYQDKIITGYTLIDRYVYGQENQTSQKIDLKIYYKWEV